MTNHTSLLLETIKIEEGEIYNLAYHQKRCDISRKTLYHTQKSLDLASAIDAPKKGLYRCRILYNTKIYSVEYIPYSTKEIRTLKIVPSTIEYSFKYANRDALNSLRIAHNEVDEIIIEKEGYLTDTTISNIAFYDGTTWFTPAKPLLKGTMREKLLHEGFLKTRDIKKEDLFQYTQVALMNAMIGFSILTDIHIHDIQGKIYDY